MRQILYLISTPKVLEAHNPVVTKSRDSRYAIKRAIRTSTWYREAMV